MRKWGCKCDEATTTDSWRGTPLRDHNHPPTCHSGERASQTRGDYICADVPGALFWWRGLGRGTPFPVYVGMTAKNTLDTGRDPWYHVHVGTSKIHSQQKERNHHGKDI